MDNYNYQALANEIVSRGINMFESFEDWTKGAFALSGPVRPIYVDLTIEEELERGAVIAEDYISMMRDKLKRQ